LKPEPFYRAWNSTSREAAVDDLDLSARNLWRSVAEKPHGALVIVLERRPSGATSSIRRQRWTQDVAVELAEGDERNGRSDSGRAGIP
jgi:hypothetical protein